MKKLMLILFASVSLVLQGEECIDHGLYIGAFHGPSVIQNIGKVGSLKGVSIGYKFTDYIRLEYEYAYRYNELRFRGNSKISSYSANAFYDFNLGSRWSPYIGFGAGKSYSTLRTIWCWSFRHIKEKSNYFSTQAIAGCAFRISDKTYLGLEYRCFQWNKRDRVHSGIATIKRYF